MLVVAVPRHTGTRYNIDSLIFYHYVVCAVLKLELSILTRKREREREREREGGGSFEYDKN